MMKRTALAATMALLPTVFTSAVLAEADTKDSRDPLGLQGTALAHFLAPIFPNLSESEPENHNTVISLADASEHTSLPSGTSVRDRIRIQVQDAALYGVFVGNNDAVARNSGGAGVVGIGLERPIQRGLAWNFELFQNTDRAKESQGFLESTKAALKLRLSF